MLIKAEFVRGDNGESVACLDFPLGVRMIVNGVEWGPAYEKYDPAPDGADWGSVEYIVGRCVHDKDSALSVLARALLELRGKVHGYDLGMVHDDVMHLERTTEKIADRLDDLEDKLDG